MDVFRISLDVNRYQTFLPADPAVWATGTLVMDCKSKSSGWQPPEVYVFNPRRERGNFYNLGPGTFVVDSDATERLRTLLEQAGELLPLRHGNAPYSVVNVLECVNCLDEHRTKWFVDGISNKRVDIEEYQFHPERFAGSSVFKIPETSKSEILTVCGRGDPDVEFKTIVEREGLKGLIFEKLWSSSSR